MNDTFGMPCLKDFNRGFTGEVSTQHVKTGIKSHDLNIDFLAFVRIVLRHVCGNVEDRIHFRRIIVTDLQREPVLFGGTGGQAGERDQQQSGENRAKHRTAPAAT
jgi:hypothetical protein